MREVLIREGAIRFDTAQGSYLAEFVYPSPSGPGLVRDENTWKLLRFVYHKTRYGSPVQVSRENQRPRFAIVGHYDSLQDCQKQIERLLEADVEAGMGGCDDQEMQA